MFKNPRVLGLAVALAAAAAGLAACSSSGGRQATQSSSGGGAGVANTPKMTVAMVTHQAPGDTFWDIIRKGAEAAAAKDNVKLLYSDDPDATKQAQLVQAAIDQKVDGIAVTDSPSRTPSSADDQEGDRGRDPRGRCSTPAQRPARSSAALGLLRPGREGRRPGGRQASCRATAARTSSASSRSRASSSSRTAATASSRTAPARRSPRSTSTARDDSAVTVDHPGQAQRRTRRIDYVVTLGAPFALDAVKSVKRRRQQGEDRHLRHSTRSWRGAITGRHRRAGRRPAALPAGLRGRRRAVAVQDQRQHARRRRAPSLTGPAFIDKSQHRRGRPVRRERHPVITR